MIPSRQLNSVKPVRVVKNYSELWLLTNGKHGKKGRFRRSGKPSLKIWDILIPLSYHPPGSGSGKGQRKDLTSKQSLEFSLIRTGLAIK